MSILIPILGSAIGGTVFGNAAAGWIIGSALGAILFPKGGGVDGPRIDDLSVTSSAYGLPIPKHFGTVKVGGNIIWALPVREVKKTEKKGGIFGIGGTTVNTYTYFATFALALGEGVADRVLRIWANDKLVFTSGSAVQEQSIDLSDPFGNPTSVDKISSEVAASEIDFEFYKGTETQNIDPLILADKGVDAIPYKAITYIVFDDIPLADYGNIIPQIKVELAFVNEPVLDDTIALIPQNGTPTIDPISSAVAVDWIRRRSYGVVSNQIMSVDLDTQDEILTTASSVYGSFATGGSSLSVSQVDGSIYLFPFGGNSGPILRFDPTTLEVTNTFGFNSNSLVHAAPTIDDPGNFTFGVAFVLIKVLGPDGDREFLFSIAQSQRGYGILELPNLIYVGHDNLVNPTVATRGEERIGSSDLYYTDGDDIFKIIFFYDANYSTLTELTRGIDHQNASKLNFIDRTIRSLFWDQSDNTLIVEYNLTGEGHNGYMKIEVNTYTTVWDIPIPAFTGGNSNAAASNHSSFYGGATGVFGAGDQGIVIIDLDDGVLIAFGNIAGISNIRGIAFNFSTMEGVTSGNMNGIGRIDYFRTGQEGVALSTIVRHLCNKSGIVDADLNVSELTDNIAGFSISRVSDARTWLDLLSRAYFFEGSESDYILKFPKKAKSISASIPANDILVTEKSDFSVNIIQEPELPKTLEIGYIDRLTSYEPGIAKSMRIQEPSPTMFSNNKTLITLPVVMEPIEAKKISEVLLFNAWLERNNYQWQLPLKYLKLDPTDVVSITTDLGVFISRIVKLELSDEFITKIAGISHEEALYFSAINAGGGDFVPQVIPGPNLTKLYMINIPLLAPNHDTIGNGMLMYFAMSGRGQPNWEGALLFGSDDEGDFSANDIGQSFNEVFSGITLSALGDTVFPNSVDNTNSINFSTSTGDSNIFVTRPIIDMYNDITTWVLVGEEIIQYSTVVIESNNSITLSGLIRGRKNTEDKMTGHVSGERILFLDADNMEAIVEGVSNLDKTRFYKGVGFGELISTSETISQLSGGEAEKPYSVAQLKETLSGGDSVITWSRRSRTDISSFLDGNSQNLMDEELEQYEVDTIIDGAVVSTVLLEAVRTHTITAAEKLAITPPAILDVNVYQMSGLVGRGRLLDSITIIIPSTDLFFSSVVLLVGFEGLDGSTLFIDDSLNNHTLSGVANAQIDTSKILMGTSSLLLDGVDDNVIASDNDDWDFGSGAFTIEAIIHPVALGSERMIVAQFGLSPNRAWAFGVTPAGNLIFYWSTTGSNFASLVSGVGTIVVGNTFSVCAERSNDNTLRLYINGSIVGNVANAVTYFNPSNVLSIGSRDTDDFEFSGWIDEVRITKGVARYEGAYTPLTVEFPRQ